MYIRIWSPLKIKETHHVPGNHCLVWIQLALPRRPQFKTENISLRLKAPHTHMQTSLKTFWASYVDERQRKKCILEMLFLHEKWDYQDQLFWLWQDLSLSIALFLTWTFPFFITDYVTMLLKGKSFFEIQSLHVSYALINSYWTLRGLYRKTKRRNELKKINVKFSSSVLKRKAKISFSSLQVQPFRVKSWIFKLI